LTNQKNKPAKEKESTMKIKFMFCLFVVFNYSLSANNISVTNISLSDQNTAEHYAMVKFNISWENSWRTSSLQNNWDARIE